MSMKKKRLLRKRTSSAFGKKIYLLGKGRDNRLLWLEEPSWDCDWYWGFGYVETYTNNKNPRDARDIDSHQHIVNLLGEGMRKDGDYCYNMFNSKIFKNTTFTAEEGWELTELFKRFYLLQKVAEYYWYGGAGVSTIEGFSRKNRKRANIINQKEIPEITKRILDMLSPRIPSRTKIKGGRTA